MSADFDPTEAAALREVHGKRRIVGGGLTGWCRACGTDYPCLTAQALDALAALQAERDRFRDALSRITTSGRASSYTVRIARASLRLDMAGQTGSGETITVALERRDDAPVPMVSGGWPMHNLVAHPLSEILYWLGLGNLGNQIHDATLPEHEEGTGRG